MIIIQHYTSSCIVWSKIFAMTLSGCLERFFTDCPQILSGTLLQFAVVEFRIHCGFGHFIHIYYIKTAVSTIKICKSLPFLCI